MNTRRKSWDKLTGQTEDKRSLSTDLLTPGRSPNSTLALRFNLFVHRPTNPLSGSCLPNVRLEDISLYIGTLSNVHSLSVLTAIFQVNLGQPVFAEAKDDGGGDNWSYKSCKAPVKSSPTNQRPVFLQAGCSSCRPTNSVKALKVKMSHPMDLLTPSSPGVFQLCL